MKLLISDTNKLVGIVGIRYQQQLRITNMLFSQNRLRKKKDFERAMKDRASKSAAVSFLSARFISNELPYSRIGFVVSKKISKKAVIRNKVKRRLREISRDIIKGSEKGLDIVIFTKPEIAQSDFIQIKNELETLLKKISDRSG